MENVLQKNELHLDLSAGVSSGGLVVKFVPGMISAMGFNQTYQADERHLMEWFFVIKVANPTAKPVVIEEIEATSRGKGYGADSRQSAMVRVVKGKYKKLSRAEELEINMDKSLPILVPAETALAVEATMQMWCFKKRWGLFKKYQPVKSTDIIEPDIYDRYRTHGEKIVIKTSAGKLYLYTGHRTVDGLVQLLTKPVSLRQLFGLAMTIIAVFSRH